jgi:hypothetical protein
MYGVWDELRISLTSASTTPDAPFCPVLRRMCDQGRLGHDHETVGTQGDRQHWFHCTETSPDDLVPLVGQPIKYIFMELFHEGRIIFAFNGNRIYWAVRTVHDNRMDSPPCAFGPN